jgi:hypothetical protein
MHRMLLAGTLLLSAPGACASPSARPDARTERSERQRDSVLGASRIPGAVGVRRALEASDSGAARRTREASVDSAP